MKKYIIYLVLIGIITSSSCTKNFEELNTDVNRFEKAMPEAVMANVIKRTNDAMGNNNTQRWWDIAHFLIQQANRYDVSDGNIWRVMYVDVLADIQNLISNYEDDPSYNNRVQAAKIWRSYVQSLLVSQYGPIPITQANNPKILQDIIFETENEAYAIILNDLKDAASKIDASKDKFSYDVLYEGNMLSWKKFANTLRLRIALQCTRNLGNVATQHVTEVMADEANLINRELETAKMKYEDLINNENPIFIYFKRNAFIRPLPRMSDFILLYLRSYKDPRLGKYYKPIPEGNRPTYTDTLKNVATDSMYVVSYRVPYSGLPKSWKPSYWTSFTQVADPLQQQQGITPNINFSEAFDDLYLAKRPFTVLSYAEAQFLKSEAKELGLGGTQTAEQYYLSGIDANFAVWGVSSSEATAYKAQNGVKWGTEGKGYNNYLGITNADIPLTNINKIWVQSWLNHYPDGAFEVWNLQRRTRAIRFPPHTNVANSFLAGTPADIPHRGIYPTNLISLNPVGYKDALTKLGMVAPNDSDPSVYLKFETPYTVLNWVPQSANYHMAYLNKFYGTTIEELQAAGISYTLISKYK